MNVKFSVAAPAAIFAALSLGLAGCGGVNRNAEVGKRLTENDPAGQTYDVRCDDHPTVGSNATPCSWYNGEHQGWVCARFDSSGGLLGVERSYVNGTCG